MYSYWRKFITDKISLFTCYFIFLKYTQPQNSLFIINDGESSCWKYQWRIFIQKSSCWHLNLLNYFFDFYEFWQILNDIFNSSESDYKWILTGKNKLSWWNDIRPKRETKVSLLMSRFKMLQRVWLCKNYILNGKKRGKSIGDV